MLVREKDLLFLFICKKSVSIMQYAKKSLFFVKKLMPLKKFMPISFA